MNMNMSILVGRELSERRFPADVPGTTATPSTYAYAMQSRRYAEGVVGIKVQAWGYCG
jgi:hypothetical protein